MYPFMMDSVGGERQLSSFFEFLWSSKRHCLHTNTLFSAVTYVSGDKIKSFRASCLAVYWSCISGLYAFNENYFSILHLWHNLINSFSSTKVLHCASGGIESQMPQITGFISFVVLSVTVHDSKSNKKAFEMQFTSSLVGIPNNGILNSSGIPKSYWNGTACIWFCGYDGFPLLCKYFLVNISVRQSGVLSDMIV